MTSSATRRVRDLAAVMLMAAAAAAPCSADEPDRSGRNQVRAGASVRIVDAVAGDLLAAGGRVAVERDVGSDVALIGGDVVVQGSIGEDLRAAGGQVRIEGRVGGDAHVAGGRVTIGRSAAIAGSAWIAGGEVEVFGRLSSGSEVRAGHAVLAGEVDGDLLVEAETIELQSGARIKGKLTYASAQPLVRDPGARIDGGEVRQALPERPGTPQRAPASGGFAVVSALLGLVAAAAVWTLLFPRLAEGAQARLARAPGASLALGAAVLFVAPVLMLLLLVTLIGAPLAFGLLAAYGLVLLAGYLVVAGMLGDRLLQAAAKAAPTRAQRLAALGAGVVLLALLAVVPVVGWLLTLLALMAGTGALVERLRPAPKASAA